MPICYSIKQNQIHLLWAGIKREIKEELEDSWHYNLPICKVSLNEQTSFQ